MLANRDDRPDQLRLGCGGRRFAVASSERSRGRAAEHVRADSQAGTASRGRLVHPGTAGSHPHRGGPLVPASCATGGRRLHPGDGVGDRPVTIADLSARPLVLPDAGYADTDPTRQQLSIRAQRQGFPLVPDIEVETGAAALSVAASGLAGAIASVPVAEALGYTKHLTWASLDPPLIETFAVITRDPNSLSPATEAMIELVNQHMRMLHHEHE
ncbi:MAG: LysR family transcriptional regulator substrate-binding protein [Microlunatus sp.]